MNERDESERVLRQAKLLGEDSLNSLDRWRLRQVREEEARAAQKRAEERAQQQHETRTTAEQLRAEMADIRAEMNRLHDVVLEATGSALGEISNKTCDWAEKLIRELQGEMTTSIARVHGELMGRIDNLMPEPRARAKFEFKFAAERDDSDIVNDLPDPRSIVRKTTIN
jgi:hypothetical protein